MRESAAEAEESKVDVRREDKTIRKFAIEVGARHLGEILRIDSLSIMKDQKIVERAAKISLMKDQHLLLTGPNGIGKSTLLEHLAHGTDVGAEIAEGAVVGYYRQDFSTLNFDDTVYEALESAMDRPDEHILRSVAAGFLITGEMMAAVPRRRCVST